MHAKLLGVALSLSLGGCTVLPGLHLDMGPEDADPAFELVRLDAQVVMQERLRAVEDRRRRGNPPALLSVREADDTYEYQVGPGDVLQVIVWDHPELTNPVGDFRDAEVGGRLVERDGTIFYPYIGRLSVVGLTVPQISAQIARELERVLQEPQVDVRVVAYRSQRVQVTGEVDHPGVVTLGDTPKGLLEAINERGGLTGGASRQLVRLTRDDSIYEVDMDALYARGDASRNILLRHGDVVHVPDSSREKVFVLGEAGGQQSLPMDRGYMTLTEALASSSGLRDGMADRRAVYVFRSGDMLPEADPLEDWSPRIFALDLSRADSLLLADQFELSARDVIYVSSTDLARWNRVISQILPTVSTLFQLERLMDSVR